MEEDYPFSHFHRGVEKAVNEHPIIFNASGAALPAAIKEVRAWRDEVPPILLEMLEDVSEKGAFLTGKALAQLLLPSKPQSDEELLAQVEAACAEDAAKQLVFRMSAPRFAGAQNVFKLLSPTFQARARCLVSTQDSWEVEIKVASHKSINLWLEPGYLSASLRYGVDRVLYTGECDPKSTEGVARVLSNTVACLHG